MPYVTANPPKTQGAVDGEGLNSRPGGGDLQPTTLLQAANPHAKVLSPSLNGWNVNREMGEAIQALVTQYNVMKHGAEGADAFILQWRLYPNTESHYIIEYGPNGTDKDTHEGCGCGCGG